MTMLKQETAKMLYVLPGIEPIRENIRTSAFRTDLTSFGPYFKTSVRIFSRMDLTIGQ